MSPRQKQLADLWLTISHKIVTLVGIPIVALMVGDMYSDFKNIRKNDILQDERIKNIVGDLSKTNEELKETQLDLKNFENYIRRIK